MKQIERRTIATRNRLIKRGKQIFHSAIRKQYEQAVSIIQTVDLMQIDDAISGGLSRDPVESAYPGYYASAADIAQMWRDYHNRKKADEPVYYAKFQHSLRNYGTQLARVRAQSITSTTEEQIIRVSSAAIKQGFELGLGVDEIRDMVLEEVNQQFQNITTARAQLIAQTEMIAASNQAAMDGTRSLGEPFKKFWSTSGKGNSRDSHIEAENDSIAVGGYDENEPFINGLLFPGDPTAPPEEICNCHCTLLTELV
jgi:hypothetical protein